MVKNCSKNVVTMEKHAAKMNQTVFELTFFKKITTDMDWAL